MPLEIAAWPLLAVIFGLLPVGAGLLGKADVPTALKGGALIAGIVVTLQALIAWALVGDYITATVLGIAGMTLVAFGIAGFSKADMPTLGQLGLYLGLVLVILGIYVMDLAAWALDPLLVLGLAVLLFGIAVWGAGLAVLGKIGAAVGGGTVLAVCVINFILSFVLLFNLV